MPDFHGPIQHVAIVRTLWLILAFPVAAMLAIAAYGAWRALAHPAGSRRPLEESVRKRIANLSIVGVAASLAVGVAHAALLSRKPADERFLLEHLWRMVRVGQLDASFDLALDPLSSAMTVVVAGVGLWFLVRAASARTGDPSSADVWRFASLNGLVAALLLLVLAENFVVLLLGWEIVGLCAWALAGGAIVGPRAFLVNRAADAALVLGIALLYWGLGGAWENGDYVPDLSARFASVEVGPAVASEPAEDRATREENGEPEADEAGGPRLPPTTGEGYLTLTSYSGAVVFMDDARAPLERAPRDLLRAPFDRFPVKGGLHSFRIHPGAGLEDSLVSHVSFGEGREIALASFGPSVTFRNVRDQLAVRDARGRAPVREALLTKRAWGSTTVLTLACVLLVLGAAGKTAGPAFASSLLHAATGVYVVERLGFLIVLSPPACVVVGASAALVALAIALARRRVAPGRLDAIGAWVYRAVTVHASAFLAEFDARVIDGFVRAGALGTRAVAWIVGRADEAIVDGAARGLSAATLRAGSRLQSVQSGRVQTYVLVLVFGLMALAFIPYWLR